VKSDLNDIIYSKTKNKLPFSLVERLDLIKKFTPNPKYLSLDELNKYLCGIIKENPSDDFIFNSKKYIVPKNNEYIIFMRTIIPTVIKKLIMDPFNLANIDIGCK